MLTTFQVEEVNILKSHSNPYKLCNSFGWISHPHRCCFTEGWSGTTHPLFLVTLSDSSAQMDGHQGRWRRRRISSLSFNTYKLVFNQLTSFCGETCVRNGLCHFHPNMCGGLRTPKMSKIPQNVNFRVDSFLFWAKQKSRVYLFKWFEIFFLKSDCHFVALTNICTELKKTSWPEKVFEIPGQKSPKMHISQIDLYFISFKKCPSLENCNLRLKYVILSRSFEIGHFMVALSKC